MSAFSLQRKNFSRMGQGTMTHVSIIGHLPQTRLAVSAERIMIIKSNDTRSSCVWKGDQAFTSSASPRRVLVGHSDTAPSTHV